MLHDYEILDYYVNLKEHILTLHVKLNDTIKKINFNKCIAHYFEYPIQGSIILDIELINNIQKFINKNEYIFKKGLENNWPIIADNLDELNDYLLNNHFEIYRIYSSYGLSGWIISEKYSIFNEI